MSDYISRQAAIDIAYPFDDNERNLIDALEELPSEQPEYYDYYDIDDVWEFYAEEQDINLTDGAKQLKDAMWVGYWKGKQDAQPTADVVEVVRCKDCLHGSWCEDVLWCNITDEPMTENDFCSKGDRI